MRIGIVGCGTAGQASAVLLARSGHAVTVLERVASPGPVGAGLLLQPTGLSVLARLGLAHDALALGAPVHRLLGTSVSGRTVLDAAYADLDPALFGLGIHRGSLFSILQDALDREPVDLRVGIDARSVRQDDRAATVIDARGRDHGPFDLVIVADGARSAIRTCMNVARRARQYPWAALWTVADDPDGRFQGVLRQVYADTRRMIGFLPAGTPRGSTHPAVTLFWSLRATDLDRCRAAGINAWKNDVRRLTHLADPLLDQADTFDRFIFAPYFDVVLRRPDHGRVLFIGDAAHATSPQLGQGANLALLDAAALADELTADDRPDQVSHALRRFAHARRAQVAFYQTASRWLTPVFQSGFWPIAPPRDLLFRPLSRVPYIRRQMLLSLAGVKDGLFSARPVPPLPARADARQPSISGMLHPCPITPSPSR
jgi:2-polyprenyl-6-methoxyphenol hydroxylase-like FAD-dependent oxidoreductase